MPLTFIHILSTQVSTILFAPGHQPGNFSQSVASLPEDLALGVAVGSSTQIALLVVPFSVIVGWAGDAQGVGQREGVEWGVSSGETFLGQIGQMVSSFEGQAL